MTTTWYVLKVIAKREALVAKEIRTGLGLIDFVPYERFEARRAGRTLVVERPIISGYVFAGTKHGVMPWRDIMEIRHVYDWMRDGETPSKVTDLEVQRMQHLLAAHNSLKTSQRHLQPGDRVKVSDGPFASMETLLMTVKGNWASVMLPMLGGPREVQIPTSLLERVA